MQRSLQVAALLCVAGVLTGCGRDANPTAPTRTDAPAPTVQTITIGSDANIASLVMGGTTQLKATARLSDGTDYDITSLASWTTGDPIVATVSSTGLVTARGPGTARIRAAYQQSSASFTFDVSPSDEQDSGQPVPGGNPPSDGGTPTPPSPPGSPSPAPGPGTPIPSPPGSPAPVPGPGVPPSLPPTIQSLTITGDNTVPVGRSAQLKAIATMSDGSQKDVTTSADWGADDSLIGIVTQSGLFTGILPGSNIVTARYNGKNAEKPVEVTPLQD